MCTYKRNRLLRSASLLVAIATAAFCQNAKGQTHAAAPLRTVVQVRTLPQLEAKAGHPVHLTGAVAVLSGWKNSFFFTDHTAGISIDRDDTLPELHAGDTVEIDGITNDGKFAPVVISHRVRITGHAPLPRASHLFTSSDFADGKQDSQWVAVRGTVESAEVKELFGRNFLVLALDIGHGSLLTVRLLHYTPEVITRLNGALVRVEGVCGSVFNTQRQFIGPRLFVDTADSIRIERAAPQNPFGGKLTSISDLLRFSADRAPTRRVTLQGTATYVVPGNGFYLQNGTQAVFVETQQQTLVNVGMNLLVAGYPHTSSYSPRVVNAIYQMLPNTVAINPVTVPSSTLITAADGFTYAPYDGLLVRVRGKLLQEVPGTSQDLLLLRGDADVFSVKLPHAVRGNASLKIGSELEVTGICVAIADESHEARSAEVLLRSASDVRVIRGAPWWNAGNALWMVVLLLVLILSMLAWIAFTRRQSRLHDLIAMDPLTGLYNRRGFLLLAHEKWLDAKRRSQQMHVYFVDLDRFKEVNDTFGHKQGDQALQTVASLLKDCFRKTDVIGRLGGDEFAIVAIDSPEAAVRERLEKARRNLNDAGAHAFEIEWSIGALQCERSMAHLSIEDLLSRADGLMYEQKRQHHLVFA